jgi:hypothetical protein
MKVIVWVLFLLACVACNKKSEDMPPAAAAPSEPAPVAAQPAAAEPAAAPAEDENKPMDASKAKAFVAYQAKLVEIMKGAQKIIDEAGKKQQAGQYQGVTGTVRGYNDLQKFAGQGEKLEAARKAAGLTEDEVTALGEIETHVLVRNADGVATQFKDKIDETTKAIAAMPADQRPAAEQSLAELKKAQAEFMELKEEREKYGNAIVDAMIAVEPELKAQNKDMQTPSK